MLQSKLRAFRRGADAQQLDLAGSVGMEAANPLQVTSLSPTPKSLINRDFDSGYIAFFYWGNTAPDAVPISSFRTTWTVPPIPETGHGAQLLYLFNALQPTSGVSRILQPVLQYGVSAAGGGDYWSVASWWVNDGEASFTPAIEVTPGQSLEGILTLTSINTSDADNQVYEYTSAFAGIPATSMTISSPVELTFAWEVLEFYRVNQTSDLPKGKTEMTSINIIDDNGQHPPVTWTVSADDGFGALVVVDGPTDGEVDITYPDR